MVLGITLVPAQIVEIKSSTLKNIVGVSGLLGIVLVGIGIFIGDISLYNIFITIDYSGSFLFNLPSF
jgi:hypothetical protein